MKLITDTRKEIKFSFSRDDEKTSVSFLMQEDKPFTIEALKLEVDGENQRSFVELSPEESDQINDFLLASYEGKRFHSGVKDVVLTGEGGLSLRICYSNYGDPFDEVVNFTLNFDDTQNKYISAEGEERQMFNLYVKALQAANQQ